MPQDRCAGDRQSAPRMMAPLAWRETETDTAATAAACNGADGFGCAVVWRFPSCFVPPANPEIIAAPIEATIGTACPGDVSQCPPMTNTIEDMQHRAKKRAIQLLQSDAMFALRLQTSEPVMVRDALGCVSSDSAEPPTKKHIGGKESPASVATKWIDAPSGDTAADSRPFGTPSRGAAGEEEAQAETAQEHADRLIAAGCLAQWATETRLCACT